MMEFSQGPVRGPLRIVAAIATIVLLCISFERAQSAPARPSPLVEESRLWRKDSLLQKYAKKMNPLSKAAGDGALGLNRKFPEKVLVDHQLQGWDWIRSGVALGNGFIIDRGIMAFEWAFARMKDDGVFGESKTIEIANFLGIYARAVLLLRSAKLEEKAKRLERLAPRLEVSLRSPRSLLGEKRWDAAEKKSWVTHQRIQAAAAAYWIGRLLANPSLRKTADLWLDEALRRQEATGFFPSGVPVKSKAATKSQLEALDALQGLAWADATYAIKLRSPIERGFRWLQATKARPQSSPVTFATYAAWTKNPYARKVAEAALN